MPTMLSPDVLNRDANDMTLLIGNLQSCLALADKLDLPMAAIHIEQALSLISPGPPATTGPMAGFATIPSTGPLS